jgi:hypothetical protein
MGRKAALRICQSRAGLAVSATSRLLLAQSRRLGSAQVQAWKSGQRALAVLQPAAGLVVHAGLWQLVFSD